MRPEIMADFSNESNVKVSNVQIFTSTSSTPLGVVFNFNLYDLR
jgi:hypothetical protein